MKTICPATLIVLATIFLQLPLNAQPPDSVTTAPQSRYFSVEVGGNGISPSFSLEQKLTKGTPLIVGRVGLQVWPFRINGFSDSRSAGLITELSLLSGKGQNFFEAGLGNTHLFLFDDLHGEEASSINFLVARLGYRHYSTSFRHYFKIAYTPVYLTTKAKPGTVFDPRFIPFFLGVGYGFKF